MLTAPERQRLRAAVDLLDSVSKPFAPHEVERSSRRKYVRKAFALDKQKAGTRPA